VSQAPLSVEPRRFLPLACALPTLCAAALGLGRWVPGSVELLALATLASWTYLAQCRLRGAPPPPTHERVLALGGACALALAVLAGGLSGFGAAEPPPLAHLLRTPARALAAGSALCFLALALAPQLRRLRGWICALPPEQPLTLAAAWTRGSSAVLLVGLVVHGVVLCAHDGPLVQVDSWVNVAEPNLFTFSTHTHHHTPLYALLVKLAHATPAPVLALWALVVIQHAVVVAMGLAVERTVRLTAESELAGLCAGLLVVTCGHLSLYAQLIMSETISIGWTVLATACVFGAARSPRPHRWVLGGGLAAAAATLTRQAMQGWFVAGAVATLLLPFRDRKRAVALYLAGALLPIAGMVLHNGVFHDRYSLTAGLGRTLHYRVALGLPDLTDPDAEPGDPYERARELTWEHREAGWIDSYGAIRDELGWSDKQIEAAMQRFYLEQIKRHPGAFTRVTLGYCGSLVRAHEPGAGVLGFHNQVLPNLPIWQNLPRANPGGWAGRWLHEFQPTSTWPALLLALLSPILCRGRARILALTGFLSVAYYVVITSLVELPLPRYRLPAVPFLAIGCGLSVGALARLASSRWSKPSA